MGKRSLIFLMQIGLLSLLWSFNSCKKEDEAEGTDKELFDMAKNNSGFTWFKNTEVLLDKSPGSGHNYPFLRTRYNTVASVKLDSVGMVMASAVFPEESFIVKELYSNSTTLSRYAILYKKPEHQDADANGWVWGYINADGTVAVSASEKGSSCSGCHSQAGHIDYMLMNRFFP